MLRRAIDTLVRVPRQANLLDASQFAVSGALAGLLARLAYNKIKRRRRLSDGLLRWSAFGALTGSLGYVLNRNIVEMMGGAAKNPKNITSQINDGAADHVFYLPGATELSGLNDGVAKTKKGYHVVPFDELDSVAAEIDKLPKNQSVTIVGHSAGGGGAYNLASKVSRHIDRLVTVDPVQTNIAKFVRDWFSGFKKPGNVRVWENYAPTSLAKQTRANNYVRYLPTRLDIYRLGADRNIRISDEDHGMRSTGLRVNEWEPEAMNTLNTTLNNTRS